MQLNNEVLDNVAVHYTKSTDLTTSGSAAIQTKFLPVENVNTEEEMDFDDLTTPGDYSDYDILGEEKETISLNDEVWVKT